MKGKTEKPGRLLDRALENIRACSASSEQIEDAASRVLSNLYGEYNKVVPHPASAGASGIDRIQSCDDFQALIPAYLSSSLTPSRNLLLQDHVRECVNCRKALEAAKRGGSVTAVPSEVHTRRPEQFTRSHKRWKTWVATAAAAAVVIVAWQTGMIRNLIWPIDVYAIAQTVDGGLYSVSGQQIGGVRVGQRIEPNQAVRTGADSGAVLDLPDGSRVEMGARSELSVDRARDGLKIKVDRGSIIVTAAKQRDGHLYVETADCVVSVVGTVFAVNAGVKGSRVSVVEGEVRVEYGGTSESIRPGQQAVTNPEMGAVPLSQEVAWSRDAEALLKEVAAFGQDFASRVENASMRFTSSLVPLVPEETLVFASLPNVSQPFSDSYALFRRRIDENAALALWWRQNDAADGRVSVDTMARAIAEVGSYLGPEVVFAFPKDMQSGAPLMLVQTPSTSELVRALEINIPKLDSQIRLARNTTELASLLDDNLVIYVENGLLVASNVAQTRRIVSIRLGQVSNRFSTTPLYRRLEQAYREGVGWLLAADIQQIVPADVKGQPQLGFADVQQLVLEQKTGLGSAASRATLGFSQARQGIAAWVAAPAPMGALEFVSPDAYGVSAVVVKDPASILDDLLAVLRQNPEAWAHIQEFQQTHGVDLRRDLAEPLGNEFLIALDGPVLPLPSWKVVAEVNDAPRLENAIQWMVTNLNREAEIQGRPTLTLTSETLNGMTFHSLTSPDHPTGIHYTFWRGYMILAPSQPLLAEAIRTRDSGNTLSRSAELRAQMPPENRDYFSALMYQNLQAMTKLGGTDVVRSVFGPAVDTILLNGLPRVVCVFGEPDRILMSGRGAYGVNLVSMIGLQRMMAAAGLGGGLH